jgi:hypothetical protein
MSDSDLVGLLRLTAARYRGRVVGLKLYDSNVCTSDVDWRTTFQNKPLPPDWFRHQLRLRHDGRQLTLRSNDRFIALQIRDNFSTITPFAVNRPDRMSSLLRRFSRIGARRWPVFGDAVEDSPSLPRRPNVVRVIERLDLSDDERLHVYRNGLTVYAQPDSLQRVLHLIGAVVDLAGLLPATADAPVDLSDLPAEYLTLGPLIRTWANSDDSEREHQLARAPSTRLQKLVKSVAPHFKSIKAYLDSFRRDPLPESATALGSLAECAAEAELLLAARGRAVSEKRLRASRRVPKKRNEPSRVKRTR